MAKSIISPKGVAVYPRINGKPDTQFDEGGVWKTGLRTTLNAETREYLKMLDAELVKSVAAASADPKNKGKKFNPGHSPYTIEEDTNTVLFNYKKTAQFTDKKTGEVKTTSVAIFGPDGKPLTSNVLIGAGSRIAVAHGIKHTTFGKQAFVKLTLNAVMIYDLVEYGGSAEGYGFQMEEREADEDEENEETSASEDADDAAEDDSADEGDF